MMSAWRKIALAGIVCSPAILVVGSLATAVAQSAKPDTAAEEYEVTPEDAERVSPEVAAEEPPAFTEEFLNDPANFEDCQDGLGDMRRMSRLAGLSRQSAEASSEALFAAVRVPSGHVRQQEREDAAVRRFIHQGRADGGRRLGAEQGLRSVKL